MHIILITPAPVGSKAGNRATAERWQTLLGELGHIVEVVTEYQDQPCDLFIALHAWRSHEAIVRFRAAHPDTPLIVVLTGTDIYFHQHEYPDETLESMTMADCLIGLHRRVALDIPPRFSGRLKTVLQSAESPEPPSETLEDRFDICVIGHLRDEKDSLRAAKAARILPESSRIRVINAGKPHTKVWEARAVEEQENNPRFEWVGELEKSETQLLMQRCRAMVISSVMEGGANVVSEACRLGLPILASNISGNLGLLGDDYEGYFKTGNEEDLARLMMNIETSGDYLARLTDQVTKLAPAFTPDREREALADAIRYAVATHRLTPPAK